MPPLDVMTSNTPLPLRRTLRIPTVSVNSASVTTMEGSDSGVGATLLRKHQDDVCDYRKRSQARLRLHYALPTYSGTYRHSICKGIRVRCRPQRQPQTQETCAAAYSLLSMPTVVETALQSPRREVIDTHARMVEPS
jgi:hypothetical protein